MSWQTDLVLRLRYIINDIDSTDWTDAQLQRFLGLSAIMVGSQLYKWNVPQFDFNDTDISISPDPMGYSDMVQMLIVLKAAAIISNSQLKKQSASAGFVVVDDKSRIDTTNSYKSLLETTRKMDEDFDRAIKAYKEGNKYAGAAILAPYSDINGNSYRNEQYRLH